MTDTGYITRANLPTPTSALNLFTIDTDTGVPIYDFVNGGLDPGQAAQRRQIVEAQWVVGAGQLGSTPGMAHATYEFIVTGTASTLDTHIGSLVTAVYNQPFWDLHVLFGGSREWAWRNWKADEPQIGFTSSFWDPGVDVGYMWTAVTVVTERHPTLVVGPYAPA